MSVCLVLPGRVCDTSALTRGVLLLADTMAAGKNRSGILQTVLHTVRDTLGAGVLGDGPCALSGLAGHAVLRSGTC